jgi:hypothetical protein
MEPFIFGDCNLYTFKGNNTEERLFSAVKKLSEIPEEEIKEKKEAYQYEITLLMDQYSKNTRYLNFCQLSKILQKKEKSDSPIKIVLVSDFINKI